MHVTRATVQPPSCSCFCVADGIAGVEVVGLAAGANGYQSERTGVVNRDTCWQASRTHSTHSVHGKDTSTTDGIRASNRHWTRTLRTLVLVDVQISGLISDKVMLWNGDCGLCGRSQQITCRAEMADVLYLAPRTNEVHSRQVG